MKFAEYIKKCESGLQEVLNTVIEQLPRIAEAMRGGMEGVAGEAGGGAQNVFGEKQLKLDLFANDLLTEALTKNARVAMIASEELPEAVEGAANGTYSVAYDPLDGSSLVDVNLAVGTIVGIYKGKGFVGKTGREQVAALIAVYGPRLTFMISVGNGVSEFIYDWQTQEFVMNQAKVQVAESKKMFAPGNLRACSDSSAAWFLKLMEYWLKNEYILRYSGGMVPDVNQILKKGGGIFIYPGYSEMPDGKLRLLYECAPMAFLIEQAGGAAVSGGSAGGKSAPKILDMNLETLDQRTPIFIGSTKEVELVQSYLYL